MQSSVRCVATQQRSCHVCVMCMYACINHIVVSTWWTLRSPDNWDHHVLHNTHSLRMPHLCIIASSKHVLLAICATGRRSGACALEATRNVKCEHGMRRAPGKWHRGRPHRCMQLANSLEVIVKHALHLRLSVRSEAAIETPLGCFVLSSKQRQRVISPVLC
jgi:hypothetical protein